LCVARLWQLRKRERERERESKAAGDSTMINKDKSRKEGERGKFIGIRFVEFAT
jgi:hypothetical protein